MYERMIDDYIAEVTKDMGARQREDVGKELKAHILDSADAIAAERKTAIDDVIVREVLSRMGPAEKVAAMYPVKKTILEHGMGKALVSLAGIAVAFLMIAAILVLVAPDALKASIPGSNPPQEVLQIILSIVFALAMAIAVLAAIFLAMFVYESRLKTPYEARLKAIERSLNDAASPIKAAATIVANVIWLAVLNLFWAQAPFIQSFGDHPTLVRLLSDSFGPFLLYFNAIAIAGIIVALLYLFMAQKWVPSLLEALLSLCSALLFIWLLYVFPLNPALSQGVVLMIKMIMAFVVFGCLVTVAKQLWQTIRLALYENSGKSGAV